MPWNSVEEEPEDFWEATFEETRIVAVRIHMLRRNRDFQPDPAAMPPGVNINMLEDRRLNHVSLTRSAAGRPSLTIGGRTPFGRPTPGRGSTTFWVPLRGTVSLADLGIDENPGSRDRSRSPRDDNDPAMLVRLALGAERSPAVRVSVKNFGHCDGRRKSLRRR